ncbi:transcriptional repressor/ROK family [Acidisarcina polymorpha]|uniref:Transcriptional repressor/ROK family n=1 Tax=Acidisarcina polymorpha TaxID=2211140 RepID=A0A2Z5G0M2_9BACT|nr:ROK family protein [Acidisarcina polymorpha]AXC12701.1 transcriptional repressor/ROK family [Acidisarcina polymorpha]
MQRVFAGVDIGGTKTAVVLSFEPPRTVARLSFPTRPEQGPNMAVGKIIASLREALASQSITMAQVAAIGVSCGGPLDPARGIIQCPPNLSTWKNVPICALLEEEFRVPCFLENDANAGALAEARFGAGRGSENLIFLTMGTGLGAGLILNGQLYRGASNAAGEIGHVRLTEDGPVGFGKAGTVEGWASGGGMAQVAQMFLNAAVIRGESSLLLDTSGQSPANVTALDVAEALRAGDSVAQAIVRATGERLGEAMAILVDLLNPECIVIGGLATRFGEVLLGPARDVVSREALRSSAAKCRIVSAGLGEQIGDVASLCVAVRAFTYRHKPSLVE